MSDFRFTLTGPDAGRTAVNKAERMWSLRDGVVAWLYGLRVDGTTISHAEPAAFMTATSWSDTEVTTAELTEAVRWLKKGGLRRRPGHFPGDHSPATPDRLRREVRGVRQVSTRSSRGCRGAEPLPPHRKQQWSRGCVPQCRCDSECERPAKDRASAVPVRCHRAGASSPYRRSGPRESRGVGLGDPHRVELDNSDAPAGSRC